MIPSEHKELSMAKMGDYYYFLSEHTHSGE